MTPKLFARDIPEDVTMRRIVSVLLIMLSLLWADTVGYAAPAQDGTSRQVILTEDGGYLVIELTDGEKVTRGTTAKTKTYTQYSEDNAIVWKASLTGSFTYDGRYATCTASSCAVTVYDSAWYTISKTAWAEDNIAKATIEMGQKMLGVTVRQVTQNLSMVCDRYGNVS